MPQSAPFEFKMLNYLSEGGCTVSPPPPYTGVGSNDLKATPLLNEILHLVLPS